MAGYRRMYFLRASLRTLREVRETLQGLFALEAFREILAKDQMIPKNGNVPSTVSKRTPYAFGSLVVIVRYIFQEPSDWR